MRKYAFLVLLLSLLIPVLGVQAQSDIAASLEVLDAGVSVRRVDTQDFIPVQVEAIVGVGDTIRTDESGRARITFFADGTETVLLSSTEYRIDVFEGTTDQFTLTVSVLAGQTEQRLNRLLDAGSSYDVVTPGVNLVARGTVFKIRVEGNGRSAMLVTEGNVDASTGESTASVPPLFGIRSEVGASVSDVVRADNFEQLDAALDGCSATLATTDDVRLNVRLGPNVDMPRVGTVEASDVTNFLGVNESGEWYRIAFRGGYGWVLSTNASVVGACAGLRTFPDQHGPEDSSLFEFIGDPIDPTQLQAPVLPSPTPEATATESAG
ncbi:MAG: SH3 domain-containing protein [Phototrophicaceae bacterium]